MSRFLTLDALENLPAPQWLIEGLFESKSLVMVAGPSYSFKSFLVLDWMLSMAAGRNWNGRRTVPSKVAYLLGEGKSSLLKRIRAWLAYNELSAEELKKVNENFKISFEVPQFVSKSSVDNLLADLETEQFKPDLIVVDTFARSMVGADENDAKDTGMWIEQADRLRQLNYGVLLIHHTKKNTEFGVQYRGSTAIIGAMDTAMTLVRERELCTLTVTKQKDHDEGAPLRFRRVLVQSGATKDDESLVLVPAPVMDERFEASPTPPKAVDPTDDLIAELLEDGSFASNRARGRELARKTGLSEEAATKRIAKHEKILTREIA